MPTLLDKVAAAIRRGLHLLGLLAWLDQHPWGCECRHCTLILDLEIHEARECPDCGRHVFDCRCAGGE